MSDLGRIVFEASVLLICGLVGSYNGMKLVKAIRHARKVKSVEQFLAKAEVVSVQDAIKGSPTA